MFNLGPFEMALFGLIALMLFGKKLPEVARNLGGTYRDLRKQLTDFQREFQGWINLTPAPIRNRLGSNPSLRRLKPPHPSSSLRPRHPKATRSMSSV